MDLVTRALNKVLFFGFKINKMKFFIYFSFIYNILIFVYNIVVTFVQHISVSSETSKIVQPSN